MISTRFVPALCVLTLLALVPTWIHGYSGSLEVDGLSAAAVPETLGSYEGTATDRRANWGQRRFASHDWIERSYVRGSRRVRLTVVRSYDPKTLYHHPELAVAYGTAFVRDEIHRLPNRPELPIHLLKPAPGVNTIAMYVLRYDDAFVEDPIWFQIRTAGELLFTTRKAMTLFFTTESNVTDDVNVERLDSTQVLVSAIDSFVAQPPNKKARIE